MLAITLVPEPMSTTESVTQWINQLKVGDHEAAQKLWEGFFERLVSFARGKLRGVPRRAADEEDVALSAFDSFCRGAERGRFPQLLDRDDLWQVLVVLTERKAIDLVHHERRLKRGSGKVKGESAFHPLDSSAVRTGLEQMMGQEPTPEFAIQLAEESQRLLDRLGDTDLRKVALWKMEGYTNEEIASKLGCVPRTVERKLRIIRSRWKQEEPP
jgi:DNA-directed RNA polymerase specialized sigma24 family protein